MPDARPEMPRLFPQDYEGADEALPKWKSKHRTLEEDRQFLAGCHAQHGRSRFRLQRQLRQPRTEWEQLIYEYWMSDLSEEELQSRANDIENKPPALEDFAALEQDCAERLTYYGGFLRAVLRLSHALDPSDHRLVSDLEFFARELGRRLTSSRDSLQVVPIIEEARIGHQLGRVEFGPLSALTAVSFLELIALNTASRWQACRASVEADSDAGSDDAVIDAAALFQRHHSQFLPTPSFIESSIRQEMVAAKLWLRVEKRPFNDDAPAPDRQKTQLSGEDEQDESTFEKVDINFEHWGVGFVNSGNWRLFHRVQGRWQTSSTFSIPTGDSETIMSRIIDKHGSIEKGDAVATLRPFKRGKSDLEIAKSVRDALRKAKDSIRQVIADVKKLRSLQCVHPPIEWNDPSWTARVRVGLATFENGDWVFQPSDGRH